MFSSSGSLILNGGKVVEVFGFKILNLEFFFPNLLKKIWVYRAFTALGALCSAFMQKLEYLRDLRTTFFITFRGKRSLYNSSLVPQLNLLDHSLAQQ